MILPQVRADSKAQIGELVRISGTHSSILDFSAVTSVQIQPDTLVSPITISTARVQDIYLDYVYNTAGTKNFKLSIFEGLTEHVAEGSIVILTATQDNLFSTDADLAGIEPDIFRYLPEGKSTFNFAHREAQRRIIAWLDEQRIWKSSGEPYLIQDIVGIEEFRNWSIYLTLAIIFETLIVSNDDVFEQKMRRYMDLMSLARKRASIRLEFDTSGKATKVTDRVVSLQVRR